MVAANFYEPGDRVWFRSEDDPSAAWWPAKILSDEDALILGLEKQSAHDFVIQFYGPNVSYGFCTVSNIEPFENSSEKAVTTDEELRAAINEASEDVTANALKVVGTTASKGRAPQPAPEKSQRSGDRKRPRDELKKMDDDEEDTDGDNYPKLANCRYEDVSTLLSIAKALQSANANSNVDLARKQLLRLDRVKVTLEQLKTTSIGIQVGNILGNTSLKKLWPLAKALIIWMGHALPKETLDAVQHYNQQVNEESQSKALAQETVAAADVASRTVSSTSTVLDRLKEAFAVETDTILSLGAAFKLDAFVKELFSSLSSEGRMKLRLQVLKPGHSELRQKLLRGELTGAQFSALTAVQLRTKDEIDKENAELAAKIAAQEAEEAADAIGTELFPCPNCSKRNARFYEQQTRGGDEPSTKFVTCIECSHRWTTE